MISSCLGAFTATLIRIPQEEIKVACQSSKYSNIFHAMNSIYHTNGIFGFYRNAPIVIIRDILWHTISYTLVQQLKSSYLKKYKQQIPIKYEFFFGGIIGMIACLLTHPLDVLRTIMMVGSPQSNHIPSSSLIVDIIRSVYHTFTISRSLVTKRCFIIWSILSNCISCTNVCNYLYTL